MGQPALHQKGPAHIGLGLLCLLAACAPTSRVDVDGTRVTFQAGDASSQGACRSDARRLGILTRENLHDVSCVSVLFSPPGRRTMAQKIDIMRRLYASRPTRSLFEATPEQYQQLLDAKKGLRPTHMRVLTRLSNP